MSNNDKKPQKATLSHESARPLEITEPPTNLGQPTPMDRGGDDAYCTTRSRALSSPNQPTRYEGGFQRQEQCARKWNVLLVWKHLVFRWWR